MTDGYESPRTRKAPKARWQRWGLNAPCWEDVVEAGLAAHACKARCISNSRACRLRKQVLKQVTVLFIGSTDLSQYLDPGELHSVIDAALADYRDIVARYQGRVLSYIGDGLLAVFGADRACEDNAERPLLQVLRS